MERILPRLLAWRLSKEKHWRLSKEEQKAVNGAGCKDARATCSTTPFPSVGQPNGLPDYDPPRLDCDF